MRFFSSGSFGLIFLFSSKIHLKSSHCRSSGIGSRNFTGFVTNGVCKVFSATGAVLAGEIETGVAPSVEVGRVWLELPSPIILLNQIQAVLGNPIQLGL